MVAEAVARLRAAPEEQVEEFLAEVEDWTSREPLPAAPEAPRPASPPADRARYVRPPLPARVHRTPEGDPVSPRGDRWGAEGPPEDAYGAVSHPERFAGLHLVAAALVEHLVSVYDVDAETDLSCAADLLWRPDDVVAATRLTPRRPDAAPLTIVLTGFPGVVVHAGVLMDMPFPVCGCDACDETAESEAERLEQFVPAVAAGAFAEHYPVGSRRWYQSAWPAADGSGESSGGSEPATDSPDRLRQAEDRLAALPGGWRPWPVRRA